MVAFDLDGTLTNSEKKLPEANLEAIRRLQDKGVVVVLASGRPSFGMSHLAEQLELKQRGGYILSYNGAKVIDCRTHGLVSETVFPRDVLPRLAELSTQLGGTLVTYDDPRDTILAVGTNEWVEHESWLNNQMNLEVVSDIDAVAPADLPKCMVTAHPDEAAQIAEALQAEFPQLDICRSAPFFIEVVGRGIDKAAKLAELAESLGIEQKEVVAFGDGYNDMGMLRYAGIGVAMANAFDEVKAVADFVTTSNDECGVAYAIDKLGL